MIEIIKRNPGFALILLALTLAITGLGCMGTATRNNAKPTAPSAGPTGTQQRKIYATDKDMQKDLKGKTRDQIVQALGKPGSSMTRYDRVQYGHKEHERWLYKNDNPHWRVEDGVTGLGPTWIVIDVTPEEGVTMVSDRDDIYWRQ